jgi:hypothetical protein
MLTKRGEAADESDKRYGNTDCYQYVGSSELIAER